MTTIVVDQRTPVPIFSDSIGTGPQFIRQGWPYLGALFYRQVVQAPTEVPMPATLSLFALALTMVLAMNTF